MSPEQQAAILAKVRQMCAAHHRRLMQVAKSEMSARSMNALAKRDEDELRALLAAKEHDDA